MIIIETLIINSIKPSNNILLTLKEILILIKTLLIL